MYKTLAAVRRIDPNAEIKRIEQGPDAGKYYVANDLRIPPHRTFAAPTSDTEVGAVLGLWRWIEAMPQNTWIGVAGQQTGWRWTGTDWKRWEQP